MDIVKWIGLTGKQAINMDHVSYVELLGGNQQNQIVMTLSNGQKLSFPLASDPGKTLNRQLAALGIFEIKN